eukprot:gene7723-894_t
MAIDFLPLKYGSAQLRQPAAARPRPLEIPERFPGEVATRLPPQMDTFHTPPRAQFGHPATTSDILLCRPRSRPDLYTYTRPWGRAPVDAIRETLVAMSYSVADVPRRLNSELPDEEYGRRIWSLTEIARSLQASGLVQNRLHKLRLYSNSFIGSDAVAWLVENGHAKDSADGVSVGNEMLAAGLLHHIRWEYNFQDRNLLYRLAPDSPASQSLTSLPTSVNLLQSGPSDPHTNAKEPTSLKGLQSRPSDSHINAKEPSSVNLLQARPPDSHINAKEPSSVNLLQARPSDSHINAKEPSSVNLLQARPSDYQINAKEPSSFKGPQTRPSDSQINAIELDPRTLAHKPVRKSATAAALMAPKLKASTQLGGKHSVLRVLPDPPALMAPKLTASAQGAQQRYEGSQMAESLDSNLNQNLNPNSNSNGGSNTGSDERMSNGGSSGSSAGGAHAYAAGGGRVSPAGSKSGKNSWMKLIFPEKNDRNRELVASQLSSITWKLAAVSNTLEEIQQGQRIRHGQEVQHLHQHSGGDPTGPAESAKSAGSASDSGLGQQGQQGQQDQQGASQGRLEQEAGQGGLSLEIQEDVSELKSQTATMQAILELQAHQVTILQASLERAISSQTLAVVIVPAVLTLAWCHVSSAGAIVACTICSCLAAYWIMQLNAKTPASSLPMQDRVHLIALGKIRELQELRHSSEGKGALGPGGLGQDEGGPGGLEAEDLGPTYWKLLESLSGREGGNGDMEHLGGPGTMEGSYQRPSQLSNADPCPQHRGGVAEGPATSSSDDVSPVSARSTAMGSAAPSGREPNLDDLSGWPDAPALLVPNLQASPDLVVRTSSCWQTGESNPTPTPHNPPLPPPTPNTHPPPYHPTTFASMSSPPLPMPQAPIPRLRLNSLDSPIDFESDLFKGKAYAFIKGLPTTPPGLFDSRKRLSWLCIQGKFKEALPFNTVITGQEFSRPFLGLPAPWFIEKVLLSLAARINPSIEEFSRPFMGLQAPLFIEKVVLSLAERINPSMRVGTLSCPSFMMPIISSAQCINISREGEAPDPMSCKEDVRLLAPECVDNEGAPMSSNRRRKFFARKSDRANV